MSNRKYSRQRKFHVVGVGEWWWWWKHMCRVVLFWFAFWKEMKVPLESVNELVTPFTANLIAFPRAEHSGLIVSVFFIFNTFIFLPVLWTSQSPARCVADRLGCRSRIIPRVDGSSCWLRRARQLLVCQTCERRDIVWRFLVWWLCSAGVAMRNSTSR